MWWGYPGLYVVRGVASPDLMSYLFPHGGGWGFGSVHLPSSVIIRGSRGLGDYQSGRTRCASGLTNLDRPLMARIIPSLSRIIPSLS